MELNTERQDSRLQDRQLQLLSNNINHGLLGSAVCLFFLFYILDEFFPTTALKTWAIIGAIVLLVRYSYHLLYVRQKKIPDQGWLRVQFTGVLLTGIVWGYAGIFYVPAEALYLAVMVMLLAGMTAASSVIFAPVRGLSAALILPMIVPFSIHMMMIDDRAHLAIGITSFIYMVVMLVMAERMHQAIVQNLKSTITNEDMSRAALTARTESEQLNQRLHAEIKIRERTESQIAGSERELNRILDNLQDTYYQTNLEGRVIRASTSVKTLLGYEPEEIEGRKLAEFYRQPEEREKFLSALKKGNGKIKNYTAAFRKKDDSIIWVSTNAQYMRNEHNEIIGVEGTTRDITALKYAERALFEEKEKAEVTLRSIGDGVITTDVDGKIDYMNPVAEELTGCSSNKGFGKYLQDIITLRSESSGLVINNILDSHSLSQDNPKLLDGDLVLYNHVNQLEYSVEISVSDLKDSAGQCRGSVMVFHDITKLRGMARELSYQATHDSLTGLINRAEFERRLNKAIEKTENHPEIQHALMYLDLDQFKIVNDTCGHIAGDELLKQLTYELRACVSDNNVLARLGGDEFGLLLINCSTSEAQQTAEEIRDIAQKFRFIWKEKVFEIGVSIGLVPITSECAGLTNALSAADSACYVAKDLGRNRVHIYHNDDKELAIRHGQMQWTQRIKQAIEEDRIILYQQKVFPLSENASGYYYEVLMRLIDENDKLVSPATFIPAAERYNLMPAIDRQVIRSALSFFSTEGSLAENDIFAINLSGQSLADESFLPFFTEQLEISGISPESICLEITETAAISNLAQASNFMSTLKKMGCRFALDDFGSGLSSFAYLKRMPVDYLKIDGEFILDINDDPIHHAMVESINHIGHVFGMKTIAEFVENQDILTTVTKLGIDYAQGFGVARPAPLIELGSIRSIASQ